MTNEMIYPLSVSQYRALIPSAFKTMHRKLLQAETINGQSPQQNAIEIRVGVLFC
jgi:hypothetical protein